MLRSVHLKGQQPEPYLPKQSDRHEPIELKRLGHHSISTKAMDTSILGRRGHQLARPDD